MSTIYSPYAPTDRRLSGKRFFLRKLFSSLEGPGFSVTYWDGTRDTFGGGETEFSVVFNREPALSEMLAPPSLFFGEAYMRGDVDIEGSYKAAALALECAPDNKVFSGRGKALVEALRSLSRQKNDIAAHYDLGNDFFSLWLDRSTTTYSCAYFKTEDDDLDTAQKRKIDIVLKKIRLRPGMTLLDIGCGWGALSLRAAKSFGAKVLSLTLSEEQADAVARKIREAGLEDSCAVRLANYLELEGGEMFDRIVSVGMFEHVGAAYYNEYFGRVASLLKKGGVSLLHTLTKLRPSPTDPWIAKYIFPGGYIPAVPEVIAHLPENGLRLLHAEGMGRHYVKTLDMWHGNFSRPEVRAVVEEKFGDAFVRMWSLYLRMSSAFLATGSLDLHQFVFAKGMPDELPMTFEDIYESG